MRTRLASHKVRVAAGALVLVAMGAATCAAGPAAATGNRAGLAGRAASLTISGELSGVAAISAQDAWAVGTTGLSILGGTFTTLTERWNGKAWKQVRSPNPGSNPALYAVAAISVGVSFTSTNEYILITDWSGTAWTAWN
jgi:hypothetical protein